MAGADRGEHQTARVLNVNHPAARQVAFKRARRFLFDLSPGAVGDRGKFAMEVIHLMSSPFEGADAKRAVMIRRCRARGSVAMFWRRSSNRSGCASGVTDIEERQRRNKKQAASDRAAEIEQAIVISGRTSDEHIFAASARCGAASAHSR